MHSRFLASFLISLFVSTLVFSEAWRDSRRRQTSIRDQSSARIQSSNWDQPSYGLESSYRDPPSRWDQPLYGLESSYRDPSSSWDQPSYERQEQPPLRGESSNRDQSSYGDQTSSEGQSSNRGQSSNTDQSSRGDQTSYEGQPSNRGQSSNRDQSANRGQSSNRDESENERQTSNRGQSTNRDESPTRGQSSNRDQSTNRNQGINSGQSSNRRQSSNGSCKAEESEPWSYKGDNGPENWGRTYRRCNGLSQSPIDLNSRRAVRDSSRASMELQNYDRPVSRARIENDGHTIQITPLDRVRRVLRLGSTEYEMQQFHFHWGDRPSTGSEHTLDGTQHAMEVHFVHESSRRETAVLGVLFQENNIENSELRSIADFLPKVKYNNTRSTINTEIELDDLIPENSIPVFRYQGSLTTPECDEGVEWAVYARPMSVASRTMAEFRKLYSTTKAKASSGCMLSNNYRPIQPLNNRRVSISR